MLFNVRPHGAKSDSLIAENCAVSTPKRFQPVKYEEMANCGPGSLADLIHMTVVTQKSLHGSGDMNEKGELYFVVNGVY